MSDTEFLWVQRAIDPERLGGHHVYCLLKWQNLRRSDFDSVALIHGQQRGNGHLSRRLER